MVKLSIFKFILLMNAEVISGKLIRIDTDEQYGYVYVEDRGVNLTAYTNLTFNVKAPNDAHLALSKVKGQWKTDSYEVVIGGWVNKRSAIRRCDQCIPQADINHSPLDPAVSKPFWVSWADGHIRVGTGTTVLQNEFMAWRDNNPIPINAVGLSTGWTARGTWLINVFDGGWTEWSTWSYCSRTCDGGVQSRIRSCDNPTVQYGRPCAGKVEQKKACNVEVCEASWEEWNSWTNCSGSCGSGHQWRTRSCNATSPDGSGALCEGISWQGRSCDLPECAVNGAWSTWQSWSDCSQMCGRGLRNRMRTCDNPRPRHGGLPCPGSDVQTEACIVANCPVDGAWSTWSLWSACTAECGEGESLRRRSCSAPAPLYGGRYCDGDVEQSRGCKLQYCPVDGVWSGWSRWGDCSAPCGTGSHTRRRLCDDPAPMYGGDPCPGTDFQTQECKVKECPIDGAWATWGSWTDCTRTCGNGVTTRRRLCDNPKPQHEGKECQGKGVQSVHCREEECPVNGSWSLWTSWSSCSVTCGEGNQERRRTCSDPAPQYDGKSCGGASVQSSECNDRECPIDGSWSSWSSWAPCSAPCGMGTTTRQRQCDDPPPQFDGFNCSGLAIQEISCKNKECPIDGQWSSWDAWGTCSLSCGQGTTTRRRNCNNPPPQHDGKDCPGTISQNKACKEEECPVDGFWSSWGVWSECSHSCGQGTKQRGRRCDNPAPAYDGLKCNGSSSDSTWCFLQSCAINGSWSEWASWSDCSASCGEGESTRSRLCDDPAPQFDGAPCPGEGAQIINCTIKPCPVNGSWSEWASWAECSASCGEGESTRSRLCDDPAPQFEGAPCPGEGAQIINCTIKPCPVDGNWTEWSDWSQCARTCGRGTMTRHRNCSNPEPAHEGRDCVGPVEDGTYCIEQRCPVSGGWSQWSQWIECTKQCGGGFMVRQRRCDSPPPEFGGVCPGNRKDNKTCAIQDCPVEKDRVEINEPTEAPGAASVGMFTWAILITIGVLIFILDLTTVGTHFNYCRRNLRDFRRMIRGGPASKQLSAREKAFLDSMYKKDDGDGVKSSASGGSPGVKGDPYGGNTSLNDLNLNIEPNGYPPRDYYNGYPRGSDYRYIKALKRYSNLRLSMTKL